LALIGADSPAHHRASSAAVSAGEDGMSAVETNILYCVVTRLEIGKVNSVVHEVDPSALVVFHPLSGAEAGVVKRGIHSSARVSYS
jgi:uncharacterized membrane-anchored protein YitT (DUF2179 family)